jgi:hypothetical protein
MGQKLAKDKIMFFGNLYEKILINYLMLSVIN